MKERLQQEFIKAKKEKDNFRASVISMIKSEMLLNDKSGSPRPAEDIIASYRKKIANSIEMFGGHPEKQDEIRRELLIIEEFLPKALSEAELRTIISKHLSLKNFGDVMKAVRSEVTGSFDGKLVTTIIKEMLK